jgi:hypothetical protein
VSFVPTPARTWAREPTASTTARSSVDFSSSEVVGASPGGAGDDQAVVALRDERVGERRRPVEVELAVGGERRDHRREDAAERRGRRGHGAQAIP